MTLEPTLLTEVEEALKKRFTPNGPRRATPSDASEAAVSARGAELMLPDHQRGRMPLTKDKYLVKENPTLVLWERETRKFLRRLSPSHGHRVSAAMVYEWATGILTKDLREGGGGTTDFRMINKILEFYYGKPYMTWICGRKVPRAYRVKPGYLIKYHRPMTLTLYAEWCEGVLNP